VSTTKVCIQCGAIYDVGQKFCPNDGSPLRLQNPEDPLIGQLVADRYQIISLIGEGGMGRVYCAEHVRMGRKSAVKVINPALATTADAIARFNREAANACRINHPNVAQVYDFGEMADGTLYLAMEYVEGETLDAVIARLGPLPVARAAQITKQVADALFTAHHLDIVHRDLKPENVMLARHLDGSDWVKVVDFGIAKTVQRDGGGSQTVTTAGVSLGTPEYMSPEQLAGEKLDHRTDIYSLGLVLFNMLTGELPYPKVTSKETLVRRLTSKPRTLEEVRPGGWPAGLQEALDRALAPEIADRYASVADFGRDVIAAAARPPVVASQAAAAPIAAVASSARDRADMLPSTRPSDFSKRRAVPWIVAAAGVLAAGLVFAANARRDRGDPGGDPKVAVLMVPDSTQQPAGAHPMASVAAPRAPSASVGAPAKPPVPGVVPSSPGASAIARARASGDSHALNASKASLLADSLTRAFTGIELRRLIDLDSIMRQVGPQIERARREARANPQGRRAMINQHFWLRAGGDSVRAVPLPPSAPLEDRIAAAGEEIRAHIARMHRFFDEENPRAARLEFVHASSELSILRELAPESPITAGLEMELSQGVRDALVTCYRRQADSTLARGVRCESLFPGLGVRTQLLPR
jgi:protein kinase-like protein